MPDTYRLSRRGIAAVQSRAAELGQIWRETPTGDLGIDGHLELLRDDGTATATIVGVQVKSGASYLKRAVSSGFRYSPSAKDRHYWEKYPVPVLLVLHDPDTELSYWLDVRQEYRSLRHSAERYVVVPRSQVLQKSTVAQLFANAGVTSPEQIQEVDVVLERMLNARAENPTFDMSYFDLFCLGLTNLARSLYFGMDLVLTIAEQASAQTQEQYGIGMGLSEYQFLERYIRFLVSQNLVHANYSDIRIELVTNNMMPVFLVPLSRRGQQLTDLMHNFEDQMIADGRLPNDGTRIVEESFVEILRYQVISKFPRVAQVERAMIQQ